MEMRRVLKPVHGGFRCTLVRLKQEAGGPIPAIFVLTSHNFLQLRETVWQLCDGFPTLQQRIMGVRNQRLAVVGHRPVFGWVGRTLAVDESREGL
jgi:hypothetical protein